jgi:hypothetical protein
MRKISTIIAFISLLTINSNAQNIMISNADNPEETSIILDPKNPNVLIAAANIDSYYISVDTGYTWTSRVLSSTYGVWGDPAMGVDKYGSFYFFHLSNPASGNWIDRIVCQKSSDTGNSWNDGTYTGLNGTKAQDKQWWTVDRKNNNMYITWTQFDAYGSSNPADSSIILFSKSGDAGNTWSTPKRINKKGGDCFDDDNTVEGAVPAVGPNGEIYVAWAGPNGIVFNKSTDQGNTWLNAEIPVATMPGGWAFDIPGIYRANGLPITCCDTSAGTNRGTIYINWSDQRNGTANTDIWLVKSTDEGLTWSAPQKVNDDNSNKQQFFTWMTIDQITGYLYFVFYDRRNYTDNNTDVYVAVSTDGGNTFVNRKISQTPFVPTASVFFGDYTNITAYNGIIRPIWTRLNAGQLSIWTDITTLNDILLSTPEISEKKNNLSFENYPNPSSDYTFVSFKLHTKSTVNLGIFDQQGNRISNIINNEIRDYGKYVERIDLQKLNIRAGVYYLKLDIDNVVKVNRQIKIK